MYLQVFAFCMSPSTRHFCSDLTVRKISVEWDRHLRWSIKLSRASPAPTVLDGLYNFEKLPQPTTLSAAYAAPGSVLVALGAECLHVHTHAHTHGGRHGDFAQVNALARRRLGLIQSFDECSQVALQLVSVE